MRRIDIRGDCLFLSPQKSYAVRKLSLVILAVIPAPDDDWRLDQLVGNRCCQRIAEDDLLFWRLLVRRSGEADEHPGVEVANRLRKCWAVVGVMLVSKHHER